MSAAEIERETKPGSRYGNRASDSALGEHLQK
jgi:hypothetical protein